MRVAIVCLFVAACAHQAAPPVAVYDQLESRTAKVLEAMDRLAASLEAASDCSQMAYALRQFTQRGAQEISDLATLRMQLPERERERFDFDHEDDAVHLARVHAAAARCLGDRDTHIAYETAGFSH